MDGHNLEIKSGQRLGDIRILRTREHHRSLRRVMGVPGVFSMIYSNIGSSIYYALGVTALYALGATPLVFIVAGIFFIFTALSYAEGTAALPEAGGASSFARRGLNEFWSFFAGWGQLLDYIVTIAISAYAAIGYASYFFPQLRANHQLFIVCTCGLLFLLMLINIKGVKESSGFNTVITLFDLGTQVVLVVLGIFLLLNFKTLLTQVHWGVAPTWKNLVFSLSIVMVAFTGLATASNMAEEAKQPEKTIPRSIYLCVIAVLVLFTGISAISLSAMPIKLVDGQYTTDLATKWINDPVAGIAHAMPVGGNIAAFWIAFLAATILIIATNAGLMGISRLSYSMGQHQHIPPGLAKIHPKFRTPFVAIIVFTVVGILLVIPSDITKLADAYSFGAMLSYTIANISIIAMRIKEPNMPRPYKLGWNLKIKGREIPLASVVGALSTFAVWLIVAITHRYGRLIGIPFMVGGILLYVIYRKSNKLPIFETVKLKGHK